MFSLRTCFDGTRPMVRGMMAGLLGAALLAGCGGDDGAAGPGPGPAADQTVSVGTINGTAPTWVAVNEVRFDKQTTEVLDDDDQPTTVEALKLGMQVEIEANGVNRDDGVGRATRIAFGSALVGEVEAVDVAANQIKVLGQTIQVGDGTVFDGIEGGLAGVAVGSLLDVHGLLDSASGVTSATRVEPLRRGAANLLRLRGVASQLNQANRTVLVGGLPVSLARLRNVRGLAQINGRVVRVALERQQVNGQFVARSIARERRLGVDGNTVDVEGVVTEFTSAEAFKLFDLSVNASQAAFVNKGNLGLGAQAQVRGALTAGVVTATNVNVRARGGQRNIDVQGTVAALNVTARTFTVRGITVDFSGNGVTFVGGDVNVALVNGANVLVTGTLARNGTRVAARRVQFLP